MVGMPDHSQIVIFTPWLFVLFFYVVFLDAVVITLELLIGPNGILLVSISKTGLRMFIYLALCRQKEHHVSLIKIRNQKKYWYN